MNIEFTMGGLLSLSNVLDKTVTGFMFDKQYNILIKLIFPVFILD